MSATPGSEVTFMSLRRHLAVVESRSLRGYARWGVPVPKHAPIDVWAEWDRLKHSNPSSFREVA